MKQRNKQHENRDENQTKFSGKKHRQYMPVPCNVFDYWQTRYYIHNTFVYTYIRWYNHGQGKYTYRVYIVILVAVVTILPILFDE